VGNAGSELTQGSHLLRVQQARLRRLQFAQCPLGGIACSADLLLGALALGHVAIDHHKAAARYRIAAHLDDPAVGPGMFEAQLLADLLEAAAQFRLDVGAEFAALREEADVVRIARTRPQQCLGQIEDALEILVPGGQPQFAVEHRDPVAHIVEGDA
jgi:hypothetical protein